MQKQKTIKKAYKYRIYPTSKRMSTFQVHDRINDDKGG